MRHHSTSIVGPDIDDQVTKEGMIAAMDDAARLVASWPQWKREVLRDPDPYPSDLLAAIPWAKEVGLELVQVSDKTWLYMTKTLICCHPSRTWTNHFQDDRVEGYCSGFPTRAAALKSPPPKPPGVVASPAQPSVGERLAQVLYHAYTGCMTQHPGRQWEKAALAVRREVLKEGFAEEDTEAAAKAFWNATLPGIAWDELREASRKPIRVQAAAAISAALASRAARAEREGKQ